MKTREQITREAAARPTREEIVKARDARILVARTYEANPDRSNWSEEDHAEEDLSIAEGQVRLGRRTIRRGLWSSSGAAVTTIRVGSASWRHGCSVGCGGAKLLPSAAKTSTSGRASSGRGGRGTARRSVPRRVEDAGLPLRLRCSTSSPSTSPASMPRRRRTDGIYGFSAGRRTGRWRFRTRTGGLIPAAGASTTTSGSRCWRARTSPTGTSTAPDTRSRRGRSTSRVGMRERSRGGLVTRRLSRPSGRTRTAGSRREPSRTGRR